MMHYSHPNVHDAIASLEPQMHDICKASGATGLSLSVVSGGEEAYAKHFGFRDLEAKEAPDGDTTYFIGSVTKGMVAVLVGILVEEGKLGWSTRVASILPELQDSFDGRGSEITIADLLSHRTGVARSDALWISRAGNILLPKSESLGTWAAQPVVRDFRSDFLYNNYVYDVVGQIIEMVEQKSLEEIFKERVWEPLGVHRTSMEDLAGNTKAAKAYYALDDAFSYEVPIPTISHKTIMGAGGAIRSCTDDLAKYYSSFMRAVNHQFNNKTTSTPDSPFKQLTTILRPHNQLDLTSLREQSYALGWGRAQLPCRLGTLSYNYLLIPSMPDIGRGAPGQLALYHGGSIQGFSTAVYLLPETETAIIAMQNSSGLGDACDWIPQMITHKLSGSTESIDFPGLAIVAAKAALSLPEKIEDELQKRRESGTSHLDPEAYTGRYWNDLRNFRIDVKVLNGRLYMNFQGIASETFELRHYHHHSWTWNVTHNETAKLGRHPNRPWMPYIIEFDCGENKEAQALLWKYDEEHLEPRVFKLEEGSRRE
ncbi:beta-lactamase family [Fusarium napiforme]|uniref:Beta-lactamase family n=1 Tax=Fusarium napiforme TaxID=42672 RepID=A0A8H5K3Q9_9HYPO|nr:beta-lactamase family [Fusarium napiforme]